MLRGVRDKLRSRRSRRHSPPFEEGLIPDDRQPRAFRNISIDLLQKPFNLFPRRRSKEEQAPFKPPPQPVPPKRNDDSFSSIPSTHASKDPFLNDDVPVDISRSENTDRPRKEDDSVKSNAEAASPPASFSSASTVRKKSSLWKRSYDPEADFQSAHERDILKAVSLSEAAVKNDDVRCAQQLAHIVNTQVDEFAGAVQQVHRSVEQAREFAGTLPVGRDSRFTGLLDIKGEADGAREVDRSLRDMSCTEQLWDLEACLVEKRYEDCVSAIHKLACVSDEMSARTQGRFKQLRDELIGELGSLCATMPHAAETYAPLLKSLDAGENARCTVLEDMQRELFGELRHAATHSHDAAALCLNVMLNTAVGLFSRANDMYMALSFAGDHNSCGFLLWMVEQLDRVYEEFVRPVLHKVCKADAITILKVIEAVQERREPWDQAMRGGEASVVCVFQTRVKALMRGDIEGAVREAERQLVERAKMLASAIPRSWREGPYESGRAMCDELSMVKKGLEGVVKVEGEREGAVGRLVVRPAVTYCATLVEMCGKSVKEGEMRMQEVQEGLMATVAVVGRALQRMGRGSATAESAARALLSRDVGAVKALHAQLKRTRGERGGRGGRKSRLGGIVRATCYSPSAAGAGAGGGGRKEEAEDNGDGGDGDWEQQRRARVFLAQQRARVRAGADDK